MWSKCPFYSSRPFLGYLRVSCFWSDHSNRLSSSRTRIRILYAINQRLWTPHMVWWAAPLTLTYYCCFFKGAGRNDPILQLVYICKPADSMWGLPLPGPVKLYQMPAMYIHLLKISLELVSNTMLNWWWCVKHTIINFLHANPSIQQDTHHTDWVEIWALPTLNGVCNTRKLDKAEVGVLFA